MDNHITKRDESAADMLAPLFGVSISFIILTTIVIILRFYTVIYLRAKKLSLTWDDWLLIPSYVFTIGICVIGLEMHYWETKGNRPAHEHILDERLEPILKSIYALLQLLVPAYAFTRYSILALYLRVFSGKIVRILSYAMIGFITAQWIAFAVASALQCNPVEKYWMPLMEGTCVDINQFNRSFTPVNVSADAVILLLPMPSIWRLKLSKSRKIGITFVFGLGTAALVASIMRLAVLELNTTEIIAPNLTNEIVTWLVIEPSLYFITACLPTMAPLFRLMVPGAVRRYTEARLTNHRQINNPKLGSAGSAARQSFTRLVESNEGLSIPGAAVGPTTTAHADPRSLSLAEMGQQLAKDQPAVPMQDLRRLQTGQGIMMTTEIVVTQEEKVGDVLGI